MGRFPLYLLAVFTLIPACAKDLEVSRTPEPGTFGEQVYAITCERVAYSEALAGKATLDVSGDLYRSWCKSSPAPAESPPKVKALAARKVDIVQAVDTALPHDYLSRLQDLLVNILPLYDDDTIQTANDKLGIAFQTFAGSTEFSDALSRLAGREGYRPLGSASLGAVRVVMEYPQIDAVLNETLRVIDVGGSGHDPFQALVKATSGELSAAQPVANPDASDRTLKLALDLLLTQDPDFGSGSPRLVTLRDTRGLAEVANVPAFQDADHDGRPDADPFGRLLLADGSVAPSPFPVAGEDSAAVARDTTGRAVDGQGNPLYVTIDLDKTFVAAATRQARKLTDPTRDTAVGLLGGAKALLGAPTMRSKVLDDGTPIVWQGYDPASSPLLDMVHGFAQLLSDPNFSNAVDQLTTLVRTHEDQAARVVGAMLDASDRGKQHPEAQIPENSTLYDDLVPIIQAVLAKPGLAEDLLKAMRNPAVKGLGPAMADYVKYSDRFDLNQQNQTVVGAFTTPVDRTQSDSGYNRSIQQRLFHLIADSSGARLCSKAGASVLGLFNYPNECQLLEIDDLAVFYVQSIARLRDANGNLTSTPKAHLVIKDPVLAAITTDGLLQTLSGIQGFTTHPTSEALNRALFLNPLPSFLANIQDPARCKEGDRFIDAHNGTIFAWEKDGFYNAIRPIVQAFADHDAEDLFVKTLVVLHKHWPSAQSTDTQTTNPTGKYFAFGDGVETYEPLMEEVFRGDLLPALSDAANNLDPTKLVPTARYLFDPALSPGLRTRDGQDTVLRNDGMPAGPVTPFYLIANAYHARHAALAAAGPVGDNWKRATSNMIDDTMSVTGSGAQTQFANRPFRAMLLAAADWLKARVAAHQQAGDLTTWTRTTLPNDAEDSIAGPVFQALADLGTALEGDEPARTQLYGLLQYVVDEAGNDPAFAAALSTAGDVVQQLLDDPDLVPVMRTAGQVIKAETGLVDAQITFIHGARSRDSGHALSDLLRQLFQQHQPGRTPIGVIVDAISEVHRSDPGAGGPMSGQDYREVFKNVADFIRDQQRGLARFTDIVKHRRLP